MKRLEDINVIFQGPEWWKTLEDYRYDDPTVKFTTGVDCLKPLDLPHLERSDIRAQTF